MEVQRSRHALMRGLAACVTLLLAMQGHAARYHAHSHRLPLAPVEEKSDKTSRPLEPKEAPDVRAKSSRPGRLTLEQGTTLEARLLVVAADGNEPGLSTIEQVLGYLGTPYTLHMARQNPGGLTPELLATGAHGHFQGIILTTSSLGYFDGDTWRGALSLAEWQALADYEAAFGVRQVTWYTYPTAALGFAGEPTALDTTSTPLSITRTEAGKKVFPYLADAPLTVRMAYSYLAPAAPGTTTLLRDASGHALAVVATLPDGRENLALTFDGNQHLTHAIALAHGVVGWVTRGLYLGYRRVFIGAQVDDVFLDNDLWDEFEPTYRMTDKDLDATVRWQEKARRQLRSNRFQLDMAYNGLGTDPNVFPDQRLVRRAAALQGQFKWISHTYSHPYLDALDYATVYEEVRKNLDVAARLRLTHFSPENLVTPNITGLYNPQAMQAAYALGVRYVVSDTSMPGQGMTIPNAALRNFVVPEVLMIPRRPTNLFYNVSTPAQWMDEYNMFYRSYWGRDLSYEEILDKESEMLLRYLLKGELAPWMFHQANLRFYAKERSLLTDLLDVTFQKYGRIYLLPPQSPTMDRLGKLAEEKLLYSEAEVSARILPGQRLVLSANQDIVIPVTGPRTACSTQYGGESTTFVRVRAGQTVNIPLVVSASDQDTGDDDDALTPRCEGVY
jgi:peptidoglycan/xylan/chitin deacetylase (PgdA/CDA1 family)